MLSKHIILGVHITDRTTRAGDIQKTLSKYGCIVKTRLGLHEASKEVCSPNGLIILELVDNDSEATELVKELSAIEGIEVQQMVFDHP